MTFVRKGSILLFTWKDKRLVRMISTIHDASMISTGKKKRNSTDDMIKPTCIIQYNKFMKGIDRADQLLRREVHVGRHPAGLGPSAKAVRESGLVEGFMSVA